VGSATTARIERKIEKVFVIDGLSNSLNPEDMRRRCAAHAAWLDANPQVSRRALAFGEANQQALAAAGLPNVAQRPEPGATTARGQVWTIGSPAPIR